MKKTVHVHNTAPLTHDHAFTAGHEAHHERRTWRVVQLTFVMMIAEIACGWWFNSMALLSDGWHMATHAGALGIAGLAYLFARKESGNRRFTFGTGKMNALGGFTSAVILAIVALFIAGESGARLLSPRPIVFNEAILVAIAGLCVNLLSAWMLRDDHDHHDHGHEHHDHNMKAAYMHVLADAFISLLAIAALTLGKFYGLVWLDPATGLVGSFVILSWSAGLLRATSRVLLDSTPGAELENKIRAAIEGDADNQVTDLHLWHIAPGQLSAIVSLVTDEPRPPQHYKTLLAQFPHIVHVTVEVNKCE